MAETLTLNGTKVHEVGADVTSPAGHGTIVATEIDFGTPDQETWLDPRALHDGMIFRGTVAQSRSFKLRLRVNGVASRGHGHDEGEALAALLNTSQGLISVKTERPDASASTVTRELLAVLTGEPGLIYRETGGGPGMRANGQLEIELPMIAPFPWWRNAAATPYIENTLSFSGVGSDSDTFTRQGHAPCGLEVKVSTTGSLAHLALDDGNRTLSMTYAFDGTPTGVDWYYTDPTGTSIDSGVVLAIPSHVSYHSASVTFQATTTDGGASGDHTIRIRHLPLWKTP